MDVNASRSQGTLIIRPNGRLEGSNSKEFQETITKTIGPQDENILLDLKQISYVSSARPQILCHNRQGGETPGTQIRPMLRRDQRPRHHKYQRLQPAHANAPRPGNRPGSPLSPHARNQLKSPPERSSMTDETATTPNTAVKEAAHPLHIMVVDDEPDIESMVRLKMRRKIRSGEYNFTFACDGRDALEKLSSENSVDMLVTDINMPRMDGLTLLDQLAQVHPDLKSVVVSAYGDLKNIRTAMNRGAFDFVTKPLDFDDFETTIEKARHHIDQQRESDRHRARLLDIDNQLELASALQRSILPTLFPQAQDISTHADMDPAKNVSGDFYDLFSLPDGRIALIIADVSDKGIPAALFMMATRALLKATAQTYRQPNLVLRELNNLLCEDNPTTMFVTLIYAVYDPETHIVTYANGGHCDPAIISPQGDLTHAPSTGGIALGLAPDLVYDEADINLHPGCTVFAYTDGITEAQDTSGEEFGLDRLTTLFRDPPPAGAAAVVERAMSAVHTFAANAPQADDVTCVALHRSAP